METLIGRQEEIKVLKEALQSSEPEMVAVVGRRRVGKTFLIRSVYASAIRFEMVGLQAGTMKDQLQNFTYSLRSAGFVNDILPQPSSWLEAFHILADFLDSEKMEQKHVIFFDELPWLATRRSKFLNGLEFFWNSWASRNNVVVVVCGSAASWMIRKVIHSKGGLHNRVTRRIFLYPFSLSETEEYLKSRDVVLDRYQILLLYMAMGGIPHYLKEVKRGLSASQIIDEVCFSRTGLLRDEFNKLYPALFEHAETHISIIRLLASKRIGLTHADIAKQGKITSGGRMSAVLEELVQSGFVQAYEPFNRKKKDRLFRLADEYSLFYLRFIEGATTTNWLVLSQTQNWKSWSGYAYESVCLKHIDKIREGLKIGGMYSSAASFTYRNGAVAGVQIDLVIDRADQTVNVCEIKFYSGLYKLSKQDADVLHKKRELFKSVTKTKKHVFLTLITTHGIKPNKYSIGLVDQALTMHVLF